MTFHKWCAEWKSIMGRTTIKGQSADLRADYAAGYSPAQSAAFLKRGYGPNALPVGTIEKWMNLVK